MKKKYSLKTNLAHQARRTSRSVMEKRLCLLLSNLSSYTTVYNHYVSGGQGEFT